jgi:hypothetical protein
MLEQRLERWLTTRQARGGGPSIRAPKKSYEVSYFATKHGITRELARSLIDKVGNNRDKLNKAAEKLRKRRLSGWAGLYLIPKSQ